MTKQPTTFHSQPEAESRGSRTHALPACRTLGFETNPGSLDDYLHLIAESVRVSVPVTVLYHNLHTLYLYCRSERLRKHFAGSTVLIDGMPVIGLLRLVGKPVTREQRVTYVDFIEPLMRLARDNQWQVFHIGQSADVQARALDTLRSRVPGLQISGHHGFFDQNPGSEATRAVLVETNDSNANIVLVGFGTPRQEAWLAAHRQDINAAAVLACGACMEYVAGAVSTAPRWMGRWGLEWLWRLAGNPRRFAFRYGVEPVWLALLLIRNALRG